MLMPAISSALVLTRQALPTLDRDTFGPSEGLEKGAYILREASGGEPGLIIIATGSEVPLALDAADMLEQKGINTRVVNMPSWELFDAQPDSYRQEILPPAVKARVAVEAGISQGWHKYVGQNGAILGIEHFGASAPSKVLFEKFGITAEKVLEKALGLAG